LQRTQVAARAALADIEARGKRAILVGGTGLYVRAVVDDLRIPPTDPAVRDALDAAAQEDAGLARAYDRLTELDPVAASRMEPGNRRRIVRALEVIELTGDKFSSFGPGIDEYAPARDLGHDVRRRDRRAGAGAANRRSLRRDARARTRPRSAARSPIGRSPELRAKRSATAKCLHICVPKSPSMKRSMKQCAAPGGSPGGSAPGSDATRVCVGSMEPRRRMRSRPRSSPRGQRTGRAGIGIVSELELAKLHATGNDFLVQVCLDPNEPELDAVVVSALCDRHRGIGADGLITIGPGTNGADCTMTLVNADGGRRRDERQRDSLPRVDCGSSGPGARGNELLVDTAAGRRHVLVERNADGRVVGADVDMGSITFDPDRIPVDTDTAFDIKVDVDGATYHGDAAGIGNPHLVLLVDDPDRGSRHRTRTGHRAPTPASRAGST